MNFYKRFPADYQRKTSRLTLAQHGAYCLLLDEVYSTEQPLPDDMAELYRICRAMSKDEQAAVRYVAEKFFPVYGEGKRQNPRADEEITAAAPAIEAARLNGKKGGRPKKQTQQEPAGFSEKNPKRTQSKPAAKAPQSLEVIQPPIPTGCPPLPDGVDPQVWSDWLALRKAKKAPVTATVVASAHAEAQKAGMTLDAFLRVWCARGSQGMQADWLKPAERPPSAAANVEPLWRSEQRARTAAFAGPAAAKPAPEPEIVDATPRLLG